MTQPIPYTPEPTIEPQGKVAIRLTETTWYTGLMTPFHEPIETRDQWSAFGYSSAAIAEAAFEAVGGLKRWGDARLEVVR
jgi:hypothetical protein